VQPLATSLLILKIAASETRQTKFSQSPFKH